MQFISKKTSFVLCAVFMHDTALAFLMAIFKLSLVNPSVGENFTAAAMWAVFEPAASVLGGIIVGHGTDAACHTKLPITLIYVSVWVDESAFPMLQVVDKVALVEGAIRPQLDPFSLPDAPIDQPLPFILTLVL